MELALDLELFILVIGIKPDICHEIVNFYVFKIVCLVAIPAKAIRISAVQKIPEIILFIKGNEVENLEAATGREIKEGLCQGNIHSVAHKEFLNLEVNHGNLVVMLLKEPRSMLGVVNSMVNEGFPDSGYSIRQREGAANEINVLKHVKLGGEQNFLFLEKCGAEKLIPNVARGALKNEIRELIFRRHVLVDVDIAVLLLGALNKSRLLCIVEVKARGNYIQILLLCQGIKLFKESFLIEIICIKENDVLARGFQQTLVSCGADTDVAHFYKLNSLVLFRVGLDDFDGFIGRAVINADKLKVGESLGEDGFDSLANIVIRVVNRHNYRHLMLVIFKLWSGGINNFLDCINSCLCGVNFFRIF